MNKTTSIILFVILAVAIIALGAWYGGQSSTTSQPSVQGDTGQAANANTTSTTMDQTANGLQIKDVVVGTGTVAENGSVASVLYTGTLDDGTVFDASARHGNQPFSFTVGAGQVIRGWDLGIRGMKVGGKRELTIPPDLGYGAQGAAGAIPPNATLHFTVELLSVK